MQRLDCSSTSKSSTILSTTLRLSKHRMRRSRDSACSAKWLMLIEITDLIYDVFSDLELVIAPMRKYIQNL